MAEILTQFDYLLNAMENAAASKKPAQAGYAKKRAAVIAHVRELEAKCAKVVQANTSIAAEDPEFYAIRSITNALNGLDEQGQNRVMRYTKERFGIYLGES